MARVLPVVFLPWLPWLPWLLWGFATLESAAAGTVGPTDIVRVDDYIGAPHVLFGRTSAEVERILGPPLQREAGAVATYRNPAVFRPTQRLSYPGLLIDVLDSGRIRRVRIGAPGRGLPLGLDVGSPREEVERVLGEPQEAADSHLMYLYSDGYPDTVHFHLQGRPRPRDRVELRLRRVRHRGQTLTSKHFQTIGVGSPGNVQKSKSDPSDPDPSDPATDRQSVDAGAVV